MNKFLLFFQHFNLSLNLKIKHHENNTTDNFFPWLSHAIIYSPTSRNVWGMSVAIKAIFSFAFVHQENLTYRRGFEALDETSQKTLLNNMPSFRQHVLVHKTVGILNVISGILVTIFSAKSAFGKKANSFIFFTFYHFLYI